MTIDQQFWSGKKVLITGNTGFKGSWLTLFLKNLGAEIYGVSREEKEGIYKLANVHKIINKQLIYDIASNDTSDLDNFVKTVNPDVIFHFAAQSLVYVGYVNPIDTLNTNVIGTYNVLNSIKKTSNLNSVVVSTTDKVYRDSSFENIESSPLGGKDFYSSSKVGTENVISAFLSFNNSFNISTVRSGNVIGGGDRAEKRLVTDLINALITNSDFTLRKPKSIRPWQSVLDSILGYLLVAQNSYKKNKSEIYNLNSEPNNKYDAEYLATKFVDLWDSSIKIKIQSNEEFKEVDILKINSSKAKLNLGWEPKLTIDQMIDQTVSWEKTHISNQSVDFSLMQINEYLN